MRLETNGVRRVILVLFLIAGAIAGFISVKEGLKTYDPPTTPALTQNEITAINKSHAMLLTMLAGNQPAKIKLGHGYFAVNCVSCHGREGQGGTAPNLQKIGYPAISIAQRIFSGAGNRMPAFRKTLTLDQIAATALYVKSLQKTIHKP